MEDARAAGGLRLAAGGRVVSWRAITAVKALVFAALSLPALYLAYGWIAGTLGANPIDKTTDETGTWTLVCLMLTLAITPVRRLTGWNGIIALRRMVGLFAFFYATLHFLTYLVLDQFFAFDLILQDVAKRPFITAGFTAFVLLIPLAVTSTRGWIRRLGKRWATLHRLVYAAAALGVLHYYWLVKADITGPAWFAVALAALLGFRVWWHLRTPGR